MSFASCGCSNDTGRSAYRCVAHAPQKSLDEMLGEIGQASIAMQAAREETVRTNSAYCSAMNAESSAAKRLDAARRALDMALDGKAIRVRPVAAEG